MATLTTDPSLHSSAIAAADALTDTLQNLRRWLDSLDRRNDRWLWSNPSDRPDDASAATQPREYLSEALRGQQRLASMDAEELGDAVDGGDLSLWRQALYWASGKQLWTASGELQPPSGEDGARRSIDRGLPSIPQYRYVGTSRYSDLPGYIKRSAAILGTPPPDG